MTQETLIGPAVTRFAIRAFVRAQTDGTRRISKLITDVGDGQLTTFLSIETPEQEAVEIAADLDDMTVARMRGVIVMMNDAAEEAQAFGFTSGAALDEAWQQLQA